MWDEQDGHCYLCEDPLPAERALVAIDHDHACEPCRTPPGQSNKSCGFCRRGLTCQTCNSAIGYANDDPDRMRRMAANLERATAITQALLLTQPVQETFPEAESA